jgi:hypothetical protein
MRHCLAGGDEAEGVLVLANSATGNDLVRRGALGCR